MPEQNPYMATDVPGDDVSRPRHRFQRIVNRLVAVGLLSMVLSQSRIAWQFKSWDLTSPNIWHVMMRRETSWIVWGLLALLMTIDLLSTSRRTSQIGETLLVATRITSPLMALLVLVYWIAVLDTIRRVINWPALM